MAEYGSVSRRTREDETSCDTNGYFHTENAVCDDYLLNRSKTPLPREEVNLKPSSKQWTKWFILFALCYSEFWVGACMSLPAPFFPRIAEMKGATPTEYGLIIGIFEFMMAVLSPLYGIIIGQISPSFLIKVGVIVAGSSSCLFGSLEECPVKYFVPLAFTVRVFEGIGASAVLTASFSTVAAEFSVDAVSKCALLQMFFGFGFTFGPTVGGFLYEVAGYKFPFFVNGGCLFAGTLMVYFLPDYSVEKSRIGSGTKYFADWVTFLCGTTIFSALLFIGFNNTTFEPHLRQFGLSPASLGLVYMALAITYSISCLFVGQLLNKEIITPIPVIFVGCCITILGLVFIGPLPGMPLQAARGYPNDHTTYGLLSGMFQACSSLGAFVGPSIGGILSENVGYRTSTVALVCEELLLISVYVIYTFCNMPARKKVVDDEKQFLYHKPTSST
ncbi:MFS-type transporter SLC18B1-like isoform X2 [Tachypleus tridentatus]|uniref:MFS-type transporter SLC18B1-like isoform X2 n=1 Tax=Tachypleus tridentatus TaxID=6853 RepID=UPI003FCF7274